MATTSPRQLLRRPAVEQLTGKSRSTIYRDIESGLLPAPVHLGGGIVGWPADEVAAVNAARIAGASDEDVRKLVSGLMIARKEAA
ncbi:MAG: AlpA family phage regulatory protein [Burkholderiales bacterium]|nr:AlpA family phage regulatory protein [Burkholderiales bacterium]